MNIVKPLLAARRWHLEGARQREEIIEGEGAMVGGGICLYLLADCLPHGKEGRKDEKKGVRTIDIDGVSYRFSTIQQWEKRHDYHLLAKLAIRFRLSP